MTHPHPLVWRVLLIRTGEELGHVVASDYGTALGEGICLAAKSKHPPQQIEVLAMTLRCQQRQRLPNDRERLALARFSAEHRTLDGALEWGALEWECSACANIS